MSKSMGLMVSAVMLMKIYLVTDYKYLDDIIDQKIGWGKRYPDLGTYIFRNADFNQIVNDAFMRCEQFSENGCLWIFVTDNESNLLELTSEQQQLAESHKWKIINLHVGHNTARKNMGEILVMSYVCRIKEIFSAIELFRTTDASSVNDQDVASFLSRGENIQFVKYKSNDNSAVFNYDKIKLSTPDKVKSILGVVNIGCSLSIDEFDHIAGSIIDAFSSVESSCIGITIDNTISEGWRLSLAASDNII